MKELHVYLGPDYPDCTIVNYYDTLTALDSGIEQVHTTQPHFCSFDWVVKGYDLFLHFSSGKTINPKLGKNDFTPKDLRVAHNLERMLLPMEYNKFLYNKLKR